MLGITTRGLLGTLRFRRMGDLLYLELELLVPVCQLMQGT